MGRPRAQFPTPGKRCRKGRWRIFWWSDGRSFELSVGTVSEADAETLRLDVELALRRGEWPGWAASLPAVLRYQTGKLAMVSANALCGEYATLLAGTVSPPWARTVLGYVRELADWAGKPLATVSPAEADAFLAYVATTPGPFIRGRGPRAVGTRNHILVGLRRFYDWAVRNGRVARNPFAHCRRLPEPHAGQIVYCTRDERDALLAVADGLDDGIAVWLAFWTGMRRGEIARCQWRDIDVKLGRVVVLASKTGRRRIIPLAAPLLDRLRHERGRKGRIVPWVAEPTRWSYQAACLLDALAAGVNVGKDGDGCIPREQIRWNAFRHTFGSLLAQGGVSLDKIAAWMGNSPDVCRRHYAEFVPRDRRDDEIDCLM